MRIIYLPSVVSLSLLGCANDSAVHQPPTPVTRESMQNPRADMVLSWKNYDGIHDPDDAIYTINGRSVGLGDNGFQKVIDAIQHLPNGSSLLITWDDHGMAEHGPRYAPPYESNESQRARLFQIIAERQFKLYMPYDIFHKDGERVVK